ncbi:CheR family methyltransferase [Chitinimonas sp.]|uniref:CheR family methyltransferase n=1 Tax=Chitinimonas sp. TaxID=1934313 RepID=UPI002F94D9F4
MATQIGLDFLGERQERLLHALQRSAHQPAPDEPADIAILLPHLVVGETYFQRDPETLNVVLNDFLAPLLQRRRHEGRRQLKLWSAACCTGEEAYTLLFAIDELLGEERDAWQVDFLATDLNPAFITHAEQGIYSDYAFRQSTPAWRARYFSPLGKAWRLQAGWRGRIRFAVDNLVQPAPGGQIETGFDLILCRNVLMYFTPAAVIKAVSLLLAQCAEDGLLLVAAAEAGLVRSAGWNGELLGQGYAVAKRRQETEPNQPVVQARPRPVPVTKPARQKPRAALERPAPHVAKPVPMAAEISQADIAAQLLVIRQQADQGLHNEAERGCRELIRQAPFCIAPYWLLALYRFEAGDLNEALAYLRKLHYLDPDFALAPYLEAQIHQRLGQHAAAARTKRHCLRILANLADDKLIPEGDGLSAVQLRQLCLALPVEQP